MSLYVATSCVPGAVDGVEALRKLESWGVEYAQVMPGLPPGRGWAAAAQRWAGRLLLHHACLEHPLSPRWNLAATDQDWRTRSVVAAAEALRRAADLGCPYYSVHAGHALELGLDSDGNPVGPSRSREHALDRLVSSLDRLAGLADDHGLGLLVENAGGRRQPVGRAARDLDPAALALFQEPEEIDRTLGRVAAPMVGIQLDVAHLVLTCQARRWEPEPLLEELLPWVRSIELSGTDGLEDLHRLPLEDGIEIALARAAGGMALPLIFEARALPRAELTAVLRAIEELLPASIDQTPRQKPAERTTEGQT